MSSASSISASETSFAPASTMRIASSVPATTRSRSVLSTRSASLGLTTKLPSTLPMRTAPTGAASGTGEIISAADAPFIARTSYGCSWSTLSGMFTSCVSKCQPFGKSGRIGRSIMRAVSVPFSPARPSRLKNEPGILPAAYMRSSTSTVSGRKSTSRRLPTVAVLRTIVSPWRTTTAPEACLAILPVSNVISVPEISTDTVVTASLLICAAFPCPPVGRRANSSCISYSERDHGIEQVPVVLRDPHRRRSRRPAAQRIVDVALDALGDRLAAAVVLESLEVDAELLAAGPEVRVLEPALVRVQRVGELPEGPLVGGRLRRMREGDGAPVLGLEREVAVGDADGRLCEALVGDRALRTREVAVEEHERCVLRAADVVVRARAGDLGAAQVGHLREAYVRSVDADGLDPCPPSRAAPGGAAVSGLPVLRRRAEPRGDHAAAALLPASDARAGRDGRRDVPAVRAAGARRAGAVGHADPGVGPAVAVRRRAGARAVPAVAPHARARRCGRRLGHAHARHRALRGRVRGARRGGAARGGAARPPGDLRVPGRAGAGVGGGAGLRRSAQALVVARCAHGPNATASGRDARAYEAGAASASKIRFAPGRSPSDAARCDHRTTPSGPTMTKARAEQPRAANHAPNARDASPFGSKSDSCSIAIPSFSRNAVCE